MYDWSQKRRYFVIMLQKLQYFNYSATHVLCKTTNATIYKYRLHYRKLQIVLHKTTDKITCTHTTHKWAMTATVDYPFERCTFITNNSSIGQQNPHTNKLLVLAGLSCHSPKSRICAIFPQGTCPRIQNRFQQLHQLTLLS